MCRFVPGEVLAFGRISVLRELGQDLPGALVVRPLLTEIGEFRPESPLADVGVAVLNTDPGLEVFGVSQLSARLAPQIRSGEAVVDFNHFLPLGGGAAPLESLRLSPHAERLALSIRMMLRDHLTAASRSVPPPVATAALKVAVLDSGLAPSFVAHRTITFLDYGVDGRLRIDAPRADPVGHGTRVVSILDEILPPEVEVVVGRLPADTSQLTSLVVAHALGDLVARTGPDVVNLSVAPRDDAFTCPACRQRVSVPTFVPTFLSLLLRLVGKPPGATVTVMAAGNSGQVANSRWLNRDLTSLLIAVADNRHGERARYSGAPNGPLADLYSASAFGGDDPDEPGAVGAFADGSRGTSFAAPFITAAALLAKLDFGPGVPDNLGPRVRWLMRRRLH